MSFDYEKAKEFFFRKMEADRAGMYRMESALYHTAQFIYEQGCKDNDAAKDARIEELERILSKLNQSKTQLNHGDNCVKSPL